MTGRTEVLSTSERQIGLSSFLAFNTWNGLGLFLMNQTVISLMAIHFGASNLEIGYITSAAHVAGVGSLLVPRLFRGMRTNRVFGWSRMARGLICVLYGLLLVLSGPAARVAIIIIYTSFCLARALGISLVHTVQRDFMRDRDAAGSYARLNIRLGTGQLGSQLMAAGLLSIAVFEGIFGLVSIVYVGALMNTIGAWHLLKVPGRSVVEHSPDRNVVQTLLWSMRRREHAIPLMVYWLGIGITVLFAFQVVFLRRVLEVPNNTAILFSALGAVAAILGNSALKVFADGLGEKPMLVIVSLGLTATALVWVFIPPVLPTPVYFLLGFCVFIFVRSLVTLKNTLMMKSVPDRDRVPYASAANVMLGLVALLVGLIGGALGDLGAMIPAVVPHEYSLTFLFAALVAALMVVLSLRMPIGRGASLRETADIMFSPRNLRAFLDAYHLDFAPDSLRRESLLLSLERSPTRVAASRLRERLHGPRVSEKERVLRSLFRSPRPELLSDLIEEALDEGSYNRRDAIFALGAYRDPAAEEALRRIVGVPTPEIPIPSSPRAPFTAGPNGGQSGQLPRREPYRAADEVWAWPSCDIETAAVACKSLARIGCADILPTVRQLLYAPTPRAELDLSVAEALLDSRGPQLRELFHRAFCRNSPRFAVTRILVSFEYLGFRPSLESYLRAEAHAAGSGLLDVVEDASEFEIIKTRRRWLDRRVETAQYGALVEWVCACFQGGAESASRDTVLGNNGADTEWAVQLVRSYAEAEPPPNIERLAALAGIYLLHRVLEVEGLPAPQVPAAE